MAFIYKNGVEYTAVLDVESLHMTDFNRHTIYRMKDINGETQLYVRNADNDGWVRLTDVFGTATSGTPSHNGVKGLVPAPMAGSDTRVLDSNKGWTDLKEDTDFVFNGASRTVGGKQGVVPQPVKANYDEVLGGDGTWRNAFIGDLLDPGDQYDLDASPYLVEYVEKAYKRQQGSAAVISEKVLFPAKVKIPPSTTYSYGTCELTIGTNRDADRSTLVLHEKFILTENSSYGVAKEPIIYERTGTHGKPSYMSAHITDPTEYTWTKWHSAFLTSTTTEAGVSGDVPKPEAGSATRVLDSNKGWTDLKQDTDFVFEGSTPYDNGKQGLVPMPDSVCRNRVLGGDGTWNVPYIGDENDSEYDLDANDYLTEYVKPVIEDVTASESFSRKRSKVVSFPAITVITGFIFHGTCTLTMSIDKISNRILLEEKFSCNTDSLVVIRTGHILNYSMTDPYVASNYSFTDWVIVNGGFQGATPHDDGVAGLVPVPDSASRNKVLGGDGTWNVPYIGNEDSSQYDLDENDYLTEYVKPVLEDVTASESSTTKRSKVVSFPAKIILRSWIFYGTCTLTMSIDKDLKNISLDEKFYFNTPDMEPSIVVERGGHILNYDTTDAYVASNYNFTDWVFISVGFRGSAVDFDGIAGLVPAPLAGSNTRVLDATGNWVDLKEFYAFIFDGATPTEDGKQGVVPAPLNGDQDSFLRGNGIWDMVTSVFSRTANRYEDDRFCEAIISARTKMNARDTVTVFQSFSAGLPVNGGGVIYSTVRYTDSTTYHLTQIFISATENAMYTRTGRNVPTGGVTGVTFDDFGSNKSLSWTEWAKTSGDATMLKVEVEGYGNTNFYTIDDVSKTDSALFPIKTKIEKTCTMKYSLPCKGIVIPERSAAQNNSVLFEIFVQIRSETESEIYIKETSLSCPNSTVWGGSMEWYRYGIVYNHNPVTSESDITWTEWERNTHPFVGATSTARGRQGLVPAPDTASRNRVLGGDGTWNVPYIGDETSFAYDLDGNDYLTNYVKPVIEDVNATASTSTKRSKIVSFPATANITGWLFTGSCILTMAVDKSTKNITLEERLCTNAAELPNSVVFTRTGHVLDYDVVDAYVASNYEFADWVVVSEGFLGSTTDEDGTSGLVPAPAAGDQDMFLKADGTWAFPEGLEKATSTNDGIVTKLPSSSQSSYFLRGDNTWQTLPSLSTSQAGIVTKAPNNAYQVLKGTGVWGVPNTATSSYAGAVPALKSSSQSSYYLRGDNTWQTLPTYDTVTATCTSNTTYASVSSITAKKIANKLYRLSIRGTTKAALTAHTQYKLATNIKIDGSYIDTSNRWYYAAFCYAPGGVTQYNGSGLLASTEHALFVSCDVNMSSGYEFIYDFIVDTV